MSNLQLITYHKANIFPAPFKFDNSSIVNMESETARLERKLSKGESIHSGHFMVSEIEEGEAEHEKKQAGHESDYEQEEEARILSEYDFQPKEMSPPYMFGLRSSSNVQFDGSLAKLFECMTLAYNGKITSPKWKTFKGLKLNIKDKIRLNNIIWRAWHIQYIAGRNPVVCQFSSSADSNRHKRTEAILLEGKYWKRRVDAVKEEYKKWRMFHRSSKTGGLQTPFRPSDFDWETSLPRWSNNLNIESIFSGDEFADFSLNSFNAQSSLGNYYDSYNSRDYGRSGIGAQFMQPGLEQLQPSVETFMDTFEPIYDVISRMQNHNFQQLPTVQEEPGNFDVNKEEDLLSIFTSNNEPETNQLESELSKPILDSGPYSGQNLSSIYSTSNEMLSMNAKLDGNVIVEPQQQQQATSITDNFSSITNYPSQILNPTPVFGPTSSLHENAAKSQHNQQVPDKSQMIMDSLYSNKVSFEPTRNQVMSDSVPTDNSNSFTSRFAQPTIHSSQLQAPSNQVNIFQPDPNSFYSESQTMPSKTNKNGKYPYSSYYHNNATISSDKHYGHSMNTSAEHSQKANTGHNRPRSKNVPMSTAGKSVTIKSLLNKPSMVSSMNANENAYMPNPAFRAPNQCDVNNRANIERSLSLPIYSQDPHKSGLNSNYLLLQRLQNSDANRSGHFESNVKPSVEPNYSFESSLNNFYHNSLPATTSSLSSHSQTYSNQDSQLLPQVPNNNNNVQQVRKLSHPVLEYGKVSESQHNMSNIAADSHSSFGSQNPNLLSSLLQVNSSNVFSPHPSASSSSSSPIGSLENSSKLNMSSNPNLSSSHFSMGNMSSFNALNNSNNNRLKMELATESALDLKRSLKPSTSFEFSASKEKVHSEGMTSPFTGSDLSLSPSGPHSSTQKSTYKHMSSASLSPNTLSPLGMSLKSDDRNLYRERRRVCHINAEQKRRCNIKNGFDTLRNLLPSLSSNTNTKISKAAMLQKAAEYIRILKSEKYDQQKEQEMLKQQVESLNQTISVFQNQLPATGAPIMGQRSSQIKEQYALYVHTRTMQNWKFWIFSIIMESLLDSYCNTVATTNFDEMCKTLFRWLDQSCCLITLRRDVLNSLRYISTSTNILSHPEALPEEALLAVTKNKSPSRDDDGAKKFAGL